MSDILNKTECWGVLLTLLGYWIGVCLQKKTKQAWCNPMLICTILLILFLTMAKIPFEEYKQSASPISSLLLPGTVCLAIPLYEQWSLLKANIIPILLGIFIGTITSMGSIVCLAWMFNLNRAYAASLLPKSATTTIGMKVAASLGGVESLSAAIIIMTGMTGYLIAEWIFKIIGIVDPLAKGIALGTTSHALGTAKALEIGMAEGAMSGLALAVAGVMTAVIAPVAANFLP